MADEPATTATPPKPGKTFNFNLTGDDFHLYETIRALYEDARDADDAKVSDTLAALPAEARALIQARLAAPAKKRDMSHREVIVKALSEVLRVREAQDDAEADQSASADATDATE